MDKKINPIGEAGNINVFKVPSGYFEALPGEIMSRLPERVNEEPRVVSLWERMKPWVYMAAMFGGIALMIRMFVGSPEQVGVKNLASEGIQLTSATDIEEFYHYYEDQVASTVYRETFYLEELPNESK